MSLQSSWNSTLRDIAVAILPDSAVRKLRDARMRRYDVSLVVKRESRLTRFLQKNVLRMYYRPSMVTRQRSLSRFVSTRLLGGKPRLYHFEIHITDHCNLNCRGCGHFSNLAEPTFLTLEEFERDMNAMASRFEVEQVFLLGGEPLLHPDLVPFIHAARRIMPETRIYLMTNGLLVTRMSEALWAALAQTRTTLLCDLYPIKLPVEEINALGASHGVTIEWTDERPYFFKIPLDLQAQQNPADSFSRCNGINNCPMVRDGRLYPCAFPAYVDILARRFSLQGIDAGPEDSFDLLGSGDSAEAIQFLLRPVPWCAHCNFDAFHTFTWTRSERRLDEWVLTDDDACAPTAGHRVDVAELPHADDTPGQ